MTRPVLITTHGDARTGSGHVLRSQELAQVFALQSPTFLHLDETGEAARLIQQRGGSLVTGPLLEAVRTSLPEVLIVDRPDPDAGVLGKVRRAFPALQVVGLDYFEPDRSAVDLVINLWNRGRDRKRESGHDYYEGLEYAIVRSRFAPFRRSEAQAVQAVRCALVTFGGADPRGSTAEAIRVLEDCVPTRLRVDVVVGPFCTDTALIEQAIQHGRHRYVLHSNPLDVEVVMGSADLAITGGGTTLAELCYLGVPAIVCPKTVHEHGFAALFERVGAACLGATMTDMIAHVKRVFSSPQERRSMLAKAQALIDGEGPKRILDLVLREKTTVANA